MKGNLQENERKRKTHKFVPLKTLQSSKRNQEIRKMKIFCALNFN